MMRADDVVVVEALKDAGVEVWLDGGWGIDTLLGDSDLQDLRVLRDRFGVVLPPEVI